MGPPEFEASSRADGYESLDMRVSAGSVAALAAVSDSESAHESRFRLGFAICAQTPVPLRGDDITTPDFWGVTPAASR